MLFGNLAPNGAIVKRSAVKQEMLVNTGTARCFDSEEEAIAPFMPERSCLETWW